MRVCRLHADATNVFQPFGIGKRYSRYTSSMPARVDPYYEPALIVVIVIFMVELLHYDQCFRVAQVRVHYVEPAGNGPV